jgi:hypothetical protein
MFDFIINANSNAAQKPIYAATLNTAHVCFVCQRFNDIKDAQHAHIYIAHPTVLPALISEQATSNS